jgi:hypothetical protein
MEDVRGTDPRSLIGRGDPESCRLSAADLRALAEATTDTTAFLRRQIALDLRGRWALAYGTQCRLAVDEASALGDRCRALAEALGTAADLLDRAHGVLEQATGLAAEHGLVVAGRLVPPAAADSGQWEPWRAAADLVTRARRLEREARRTWEAAWGGERPQRPTPDEHRCPGPADGPADGPAAGPADDPEPSGHRNRGEGPPPDRPHRDGRDGPDDAGRAAPPDRDLDPDICGFGPPPPPLSPTSLPAEQPTDLLTGAPTGQPAEHPTGQPGLLTSEVTGRGRR